MDYRKLARSAFWAFIWVGFVVSFVVGVLALSLLIGWALTTHPGYTIAVILLIAFAVATIFFYIKE